MIRPKRSSHMKDTGPRCSYANITRPTGTEHCAWCADPPGDHSFPHAIAGTCEPPRTGGLPGGAAVSHIPTVISKERRCHGQASSSPLSALPVRALRPPLTGTCRAVGAASFRGEAAPAAKPSLLLLVAEEVAVELGGTGRLWALIGVVVHHRYDPYIVVGPEGARSADARARRRRSDDQIASGGHVARSAPSRTVRPRRRTPYGRSPARPVS
jgi:hypothetical protein